MEKVKQKFENWRRSRAKLGRIPEDLWDAAVNLHKEYNISKICEVLGLQHSKLKSRILEANKKIDISPKYIQLDMNMHQQQAYQNEWSVEIEKADGAKIKISSKSSKMPDFALLCQSFLKGRS